MEDHTSFLRISWLVYTFLGVPKILGILPLLRRLAISNAITTCTGVLPSENNLKACGGIQNTVYWTNDVGRYTSFHQNTQHSTSLTIVFCKTNYSCSTELDIVCLCTHDRPRPPGRVQH